MQRDGFDDELETILGRLIFHLPLVVCMIPLYFNPSSQSLYFNTIISFPFPSFQQRQQHVGFGLVAAAAAARPPPGSGCSESWT